MESFLVSVLVCDIPAGVFFSINANEKKVLTHLWTALTEISKSLLRLAAMALCALYFKGIGYHGG